MSRSLLTLALALVCLVTVSGVAAAAPVTGTVSVANGTAESDRVTVTPLNQDFERVGQPVSTAVENGSYRAADVADAPLYVVRLEHGALSHYAVVQEPTADFELSAGLSARLARADGTPVANTTVTVTSPTGPPVAQVRTGSDGRIALDQLQPNRSYQLHTRLSGAPYRFALQTGTNASDARLTLRSPTADETVLTAAGGNPASHIVQPVQNGSTTRVVETIRLENAGNRPFVGAITVGLPDSATVRSASIEGQQLRYRRTAEGLAVNASLASGSTIRASVQYTLDNESLNKPVQHETDSLAVVLQGFDPAAVEHSSNLRLRNTSGMPIPMLTSTDSLAPGDSISVTLPGAGGQAGSSGSMPQFPAGALVAGLLAVVVGGIAAYRTF